MVYMVEQRRQVFQILQLAVVIAGHAEHIIAVLELGMGGGASPSKLVQSLSDALPEFLMFEGGKEDASVEKHPFLRRSRTLPFT